MQRQGACQPDGDEEDRPRRLDVGQVFAVGVLVVETHFCVFVQRFSKIVQWPTLESRFTLRTTIFQNRYLDRLWKVGLRTVQRFPLYNDFPKSLPTDFGKSVYRRRPCSSFGLAASAATDALATMYSSRPMSSPSSSCFSLLPLSRHSAMAWPNCQKAAFWP